MALKDYSDNEAVRSRGQDLVSKFNSIIYSLFTLLYAAELVLSR